LATCGRLSIDLPAVPIALKEARTLCGLTPCGAGNLACSRLVCDSRPSHLFSTSAGTGFSVFNVL
jgi:hypothetical protein